MQSYRKKSNQNTKKPAKKQITAYVRLQINLPPSCTSQYPFSWTTPPLSERTYFMDDPLHNKEFIAVLTD